MKRNLIVLPLCLSFSIAIAGDPYYVISRGIADASVIAIYGWSDNKTPCISLEEYMNKAMEEERNYHRFSCVDATTAMVIDCAPEKDEGYDCLKNWKVRNELLKTLKIK